MTPNSILKVRFVLRRHVRNKGDCSFIHSFNSSDAVDDKIGIASAAFDKPGVANIVEFRPFNGCFPVGFPTPGLSFGRIPRLEAPLDDPISLCFHCVVTWGSHKPGLVPEGQCVTPPQDFLANWNWT